MKNKQLIVALSKLFKVEESVIEADLLNENGTDILVKDYSSKYNAYTAEELARMIENSNKRYLETANFPINEVPRELYNKVKAAAFESIEKDLAKEHEITEYNGLKDLVSKAISKINSGKGNQDEKDKQIELLKSNLLKAEQDKESAVNELKTKFEGEFISRDLNSALKALPLDYEGDVLDKQSKLLTSAFNSEYKLGRKGEHTVVLDKDGKPVLDKLGDPQPVSEVIKSFATGYGFKIKEADPGGRGTGSSTTSSPLKGKDFNAYLEEKGIKPMTDEADKAYIEWKEANKS